ncbi:hypothetical protein [Agrobacterium pusense]|uniref:Uncharacterized protein n=1 Tax=Agrobacterium pusense TaxID=648995 RepID=A0AA44J256_9HYPH|nr:hypothetical protein [Agrobacterium pusense]NRF12458.1 hypothetical protein [Agrobacterium pusense]NRF23168.1 hypothetical protein [Agrobacterium pusense]
MGKQRFKVGDWVRVKDNKGAPYDYRVGDVHKVDAVLAGLVYVLGKPGMYAKRFEPWQPRVGERVRIVNPRHDFKRGHKGREFTVDEQHGSYDGEPAFVGYPESRPYIWTASELEPVASAVTTPEKTATIKIEAGKFYRTRDGRKVGPIIANWCDNEHWPFLWPEQTMYYKPNGFSCPGSAHLHRDDDDLIAEWIDEPVAKPSNDNAQPKFKVGDIVTPSHGCSKDSATVTQIKDGRVSVRWNNGAFGSEHGWREDELSPVLLRPTTTIVALIENGQPKPSSTPHVHASTGSAAKEAKRLAAKYKGKKFGVFTLTTTH